MWSVNRLDTNLAGIIIKELEINYGSEAASRQANSCCR